MQVDPPARLLTLSTDPLTLATDRQQLAFVLHGEREDNLENVCDRLNRSAAASRQRTPVSTLERARDRRFRKDPDAGGDRSRPDPAPTQGQFPAPPRSPISTARPW